MWHWLSAAVKAASGSMASARDQGARTMCGEAEPAITIPPSRVTVCSRL